MIEQNRLHLGIAIILLIVLLVPATVLGVVAHRVAPVGDGTIGYWRSHLDQISLDDATYLNNMNRTYSLWDGIRWNTYNLSSFHIQVRSALYRWPRSNMGDKLRVQVLCLVLNVRRGFLVGVDFASLPKLPLTQRVPGWSWERWYQEASYAYNSGDLRLKESLKNKIELVNSNEASYAAISR